MKEFADSTDEKTFYWIEKAARELTPKVLPPEWKVERRFANATYFRSQWGMTVILEVEAVDGELWLHVSYARGGRVPSYDDTKDIKALFIGRQRKAIMVFPAEAEHVNLHEFCLHLYAPLGKDPLPDFRGTDSEGRLGI